MAVEVLCRHIEYLDSDILKLELQRVELLKKPVSPAHQQAHQLEKLYGIGPVGAWTLAHDLFSWREFQNGKKLGSFVGLSPTPWASGTVAREQGISKAGSGPLRALLVQLAWGWLRYQPDSELTKWFYSKFGTTNKRSKRVGIVAVARKLLILLWQYVTKGVVPPGVTFKAENHVIVPAKPKGIDLRLMKKKAKLAMA